MIIFIKFLIFHNEKKALSFEYKRQGFPTNCNFIQFYVFNLSNSTKS